MIAKTVRQLMAKREWNQSELAEKSGVDQGTISAILTRRTMNPKIETLQKLAHAFGKDLSIFEQPAEAGRNLGKTQSEDEEEIKALLRGIPSESDKKRLLGIIRAWKDIVDKEEAAKTERGDSEGK